MRRAALYLCLSLASSAVFPQALGDKQSVLRQARQSYYNLRGEGLASFTCNAVPNWRLILEKGHQLDPKVTDASIQILNQLQFTVSLAADNSIKVTHNELTGQSEEIMAGLKKTCDGMEQMLSGFFKTWGLFMLSIPFPEVTGQYQLEAGETTYRLSYKDGSANVVTTMGRNFAISNLDVTGSRYESSIQPMFTETPRGFLLSGYSAKSKSQTPGENAELNVSVDYTDLQGLKMLQKLKLNGSYGDAPFALELTFSDCQVVKR